MKNSEFEYGYVCGAFEFHKDITGRKLALSKTKFAYTGKTQRPRVVNVGGERLKAGTDYTISYSNPSSTAIGAYTVTITGKGNYLGTSARATYKIVKATNTMAVKAKPAPVKAGKAITAKKVFVVKKAVGKVTYQKATGNPKIVVLKNGTIKVKKGLKPGTYPIKVKVTAAGNVTTAAKTVKVKVKVVVK